MLRWARNGSLFHVSPTPRLRRQTFHSPSSIISLWCGSRNAPRSPIATAAASRAMAKEGGATGGGESIVWREDVGRFETPDGEAFLQYRLPSPAVMDVVHTYVPRSKRGQGLAARLCDAAFAHARGHGMRVVPTCSYVSDTYLPRNPALNELVYKDQEDPKPKPSSM